VIGVDWYIDGFDYYLTSCLDVMAGPSGSGNATASAETWVPVNGTELYWKFAELKTTLEAAG
jgi:hypothetical protein